MTETDNIDAKPVQMEVHTRRFSRHRPLTLDIPDAVRRKYEEFIFLNSEKPCIARVAIKDEGDQIKIIYTFDKQNWKR